MNFRECGQCGQCNGDLIKMSLSVLADFVSDEPGSRWRLGEDPHALYPHPQKRPVNPLRTLNRSQKRRFMTMFHSVLFVYSYPCCVELSTCPFYCETGANQKANFHSMQLL